MEIGDFLELQLAQIFHSEEPSFMVNICATQTQEEGINECGTLAIAFTVDFLFSMDLRKETFNITRLREHLEHCLLNQELTPFPKITQNAPQMKVVQTQRVTVYCHCRMPQYYDSKMVKCSKCLDWFHFTCVSLKEEPIKRDIGSARSAKASKKK